MSESYLGADLFLVRHDDGTCEFARRLHPTGERVSTVTLRPDQVSTLYALLEPVVREIVAGRGTRVGGAKE